MRGRRSRRSHDDSYCMYDPEALQNAVFKDLVHLVPFLSVSRAILLRYMSNYCNGRVSLLISYNYIFCTNVTVTVFPFELLGQQERIASRVRSSAAASSDRVLKACCDLRLTKTRSNGSRFLHPTLTSNTYHYVPAMDIWMCRRGLAYPPRLRM